MNVFFGGVIYPESLAFFDDFIDSINHQTYSDFILLLINDGIDNTTIIEKVIPRIKVKYHIIDNIDGLCPNDLRVKLFIEAKNLGANLLVIGDSDDKFSENRVEQIISTAINRRATFFYNSLNYFSGESALPEMPKSIDDFKNIVEFNYLGLSNTAFMVSKLSLDFLKSLYGFQGTAFDWYLYLRILLIGGNGIFVDDTETYYRTYSGNLVGKIKISDAALANEKTIKTEIYQSLRKYDPIFSMLIEQYSSNENLTINDNEKHFWWDFLKVKAKD